MAQLADADLSTHPNASKVLAAAFQNLATESGSAWDEGDGRLLYHLASFIQGRIEWSAEATIRLAMMELSSAARSLFELTIISDYLSRSPENRSRFVAECALDGLEIMDRLEQIDQQHSQGPATEQIAEKRRRMEAKMNAAGLQGKKSRDTRVLAREIGREADFGELYKVYSKMSHPTAWAIVGGSEESVSWERLAVFMLIKANGYAAEAYRIIAVVGSAEQTPR
jgi:hypothetical protein